MVLIQKIKRFDKVSNVLLMCQKLLCQRSRYVKKFPPKIMLGSGYKDLCANDAQGRGG